MKLKTNRYYWVLLKPYRPYNFNPPESAPPAEVTPAWEPLLWDGKVWLRHGSTQNITPDRVEQVGNPLDPKDARARVQFAWAEVKGGFIVKPRLKLDRLYERRIDAGPRSARIKLLFRSPHA